MVNRRKQFEGKSLEEVADMMADSGSNSELAHAARTEFLLRQTKAIEDTATHTARYTRYMLWSVFILALSAFGSFLLGIWRFTSG